MKGLHKITYLSIIWLSSAVCDVQYKVITEAIGNVSVAVIVDGMPFPLSNSYGILFQGEAPNAKSEYKYAITVNQTTIQEPFSRPPLKDQQQTSTFNEFFNRSTNIYPVVSLPKVMQPLSIIHKVKSDLHLEGQIPAIHIHGNQTAMDYLQGKQLEDLEVKMSVTYISLEHVLTFDNVDVSLAGRSSRWIPKLSYGLKLDKKNDTTLFGYKNLKLRALGLDPSYVRENLVYHVLEATGVPASGFSYVRLFINNKAMGLYGLIETFQDPWAAATFAEGDTSYVSGSLYQGTGYMYADNEFFISDLRYEGSNITRYNNGQYKVKAGPNKKSVEAYTNLQEFTKFINESLVEKTPTDEWESRLNVDGFLRAMAIENLLGLSDAYMTLADNYYLYRDPNENNRYTYIPSDLDTTVGVSLYKLPLMLSGNYSEHPGVFFRPLTNKLLSYQKYLDYYQELLLSFSKNLVNPTILNPYLDNVIHMIQADIEWDLTLERAGVFSFPEIPISNTTLQKMMESVCPPGIMFGVPDDPTKSAINYLVSLNGPSPSNWSESVKPFIQKKYTAIVSFYNQTV